MNKTQEQLYDEKFPEKDFRKSIFAFSNEEKIELGSFNTIMQISQLAEILCNQIVNTKILPRLGVKTTIDSQVFYDIPAGKIITWIPRVICEQCKNKRAEYAMGTRKLCSSCVELIQQEKKPIEETPTKTPKEPIEEPRKKKK